MHLGIHSHTHKHIVHTEGEHLAIHFDVPAFVLVTCSKSIRGIAFDPYGDVIQRQTQYLQVQFFLNHALVPLWSLSPAWGHSSSSRRQCVPCERTGRTRFRPRWPRSLPAYCTCSNSSFSLTFTSAWMSQTSNVPNSLQIPQVKLLLDTCKCVQTDQQWMTWSPKQAIKSSGQE